MIPGISQKLLPKRKGLYKVIKQIVPTTYLLQNLQNKENTIIRHRNLLIPYYAKDEDISVLTKKYLEENKKDGTPEPEYIYDDGPVGRIPEILPNPIRTPEIQPNQNNDQPDTQDRGYSTLRRSTRIAERQAMPEDQRQQMITPHRSRTQTSKQRLFEKRTPESGSSGQGSMIFTPIEERDKSLERFQMTPIPEIPERENRFSPIQTPIPDRIEIQKFTPIITRSRRRDPDPEQLSEDEQVDPQQSKTKKKIRFQLPETEKHRIELPTTSSLKTKPFKEPKKGVQKMGKMKKYIKNYSWYREEPEGETL